MSFLKDVPVITDKKEYLLRSFTWGLPINLIGCLIASAMLLTGHKPHRWGPCIYFEAGHDWGGMDWGSFFVVQKGASERLKNHEMGHTFQNCKFGPLMPFLVSGPSTLRYWWRRIRYSSGKRNPKKPYDSAWFEGQATRLGFAFMALKRGKDTPHDF